MNNIQKYQKKRDEMLLKCDPEALREFVRDNAEQFDEHYVKAITSAPRSILELTLHKMIVNVKSLPKERRNESAKWLLDRGYSGEIWRTI